MNQAEYTMSDASSFLTKRNLSVLVLDTCAILDIIRVLKRINSHTRAEKFLESVSIILSMANGDQAHLSLVIPPLVPRGERDSNVPNLPGAPLTP